MANENKKNETKSEKTSFVTKVKDGIVKGYDETKAFAKRNGKKILTGVGVTTGVFVTAVLIDKFGVDPTRIFRRGESDDCVETDEIEMPQETEE